MRIILAAIAATGTLTACGGAQCAPGTQEFNGACYPTNNQQQQQQQQGDFERDDEWEEDDD